MNSITDPHNELRTEFHEKHKEEFIRRAQELKFSMSREEIEHVAWIAFLAGANSQTIVHEV